MMLVVALFLWRRSDSKDRGKLASSDGEYCHECGYDLRAGHERCPECGTPVPTDADRALARGLLLDPKALQNDWPAAPIQPRVPEPHEKPIVVYRAQQWAEAELLMQHLQARGVLAKLKSKDEFFQSGYDSQRVSNWLVNVPSDDLELANAIINKLRLKPSAREDADGSVDRNSENE
jgi:hypothetical protein